MLNIFKKSGKRRNTFVRSTRSATIPFKQKKSKRFNAQTKSEFSFSLNGIFDFSFNHDKRIFFTLLALLSLGVVEIYSGSIVSAYILSGNKFYYLFNHIIFIIIGFGGLGFFYFLKPFVTAKIGYVLMFLSVSMLGFMLILGLLGKGQSVDGAFRWFTIAGITFQPSDIAKLAFVIFIANMLSRSKEQYKDFKDYFYQNLLPFSTWFFLIIGLVLIGNTNLGTAMVLGFIGFTMYFSGAITKYHKFGLLLLLGVVIVFGSLFALRERYRMDRIAVWKNYWDTGSTVLPDDKCPNRAGCSDQFDQVVTAIGSGGLTGKGLGNSLAKHNFFKTAASDDSIIGTIGEEWGFIFTSIILLIYLYLIFICLSLAKEMAIAPLNYFLLIGCISWIGFQMFIHVGANIGIIPLTGQTLPFISRGGSSLISLMCGMGIILSVSKQKSITNE